MRFALKYTIFKALEDRHRSVKFYEMREQHGTFRLLKRRLDFGELGASLPRRSRDVFDAFENLDIEEPPHGGSH